MIDDPDVAHTRNRRHSVDESTIEGGRCLRFSVLRRWKDRDGHAVLRREAEIDRLQFQETADEKTGTDEQHEGKGELRRDQRGAHTRVTQRSYGTLYATAEPREHRCSRRTKRGRDPGACELARRESPRLFFPPDPVVSLRIHESPRPGQFHSRSLPAPEVPNL